MKNKNKKVQKIDTVKIMKKVARECISLPPSKVEKDLKKEKSKKACRKPVKW